MLAHTKIAFATRLAAVCLLATTALFISGCGQKGPLTLPSERAGQQQTVTLQEEKPCEETDCQQ